MIGYLDTPSGLSGDMLLGCLVDGGLPIEQLRQVLGRLALPSGQWSIEARSVMKGPLRATLIDVQVADQSHHRGLTEVAAIIENADLPQPVADRARAVFVRLAEAEANVHGTTVDQIHFHEVGALDAIIDIVGSVWGLYELGVEQLHAAALPLGSGWVDTQHGRLPLPAPATLALLAAVDAPTRPAPGDGEWVTPTGAALLAELAIFKQPAMQLARIGTGAGQRDAPWPNIARLWLGQHVDTGPMVVIETNIDDMNPQLHDAVSERLFAAGARDVWLTPVQMKKGRPAVVLSVIAPASVESAVSELILRETTTLGVRVHRASRHEARRESRQVQTRFGPVSVKLKWMGSELVGAAPEYEDCKTAADQKGVPARQVYEAAMGAAQALVAESSAPASSRIVGSDKDKGL